MKRSIVRILAVAALAWPMTGCGGGKLETGYKYVPLGQTPTQRRANYAGPFSPEAREAQIERWQDDTNRRP